ncbi:hypothetical protein CBL_06180 [Carabus blaptoides fortunei]
MMTVEKSSFTDGVVSDSTRRSRFSDKQVVEIRYQIETIYKQGYSILQNDSPTLTFDCDNILLPAIAVVKQQVSKTSQPGAISVMKSTQFWIAVGVAGTPHKANTTLHHTDIIGRRNVCSVLVQYCRHIVQQTIKNHPFSTVLKSEHNTLNKHASHRDCTAPSDGTLRPSPSAEKYTPTTETQNQKSRTDQHAELLFWDFEDLQLTDEGVKGLPIRYSITANYMIRQIMTLAQRSAGVNSLTRAELSLPHSDYNGTPRITPIAVIYWHSDFLSWYG